MSESEPSLTPDEQREAVRERYSEIAQGEETNSCCDDSSEISCCGDEESVEEEAKRRGYSSEDVNSVEGEANLGLGCGNPTAITNLSEGERVVDLGSGGGFDCFLASEEVGNSGHVIGVDMTPEMVEKARENADKNSASNVEFRLGEIEHLPVADDSVDVIISNCVINLSPDKPQVFDDVYRVLKPGGRIAISDIVKTEELPSELRSDPEAVAECVGGAVTVEDIEEMVDNAGFEEIDIEVKDESKEFIDDWSDEHDLGDYIVSANIRAEKPGREED